MIFHNLSMDQHLWNYHIFWGSKHPFTSHFLGYFGWKGVLTHTHILSYSMMLIWFICIQWAGMGRVIELCKSSRSMGHGFANCQTSSWTSHDSCWGLLYWMIETQIREVFFSPFSFILFLHFHNFSDMFFPEGMSSPSPVGLRDEDAGGLRSHGSISASQRIYHQQAFMWETCCWW